MSDHRFLVVGQSHTESIINGLRSVDPNGRHGLVRLRVVRVKSPAARLARFAWKKVALAMSAEHRKRPISAVPPLVGPAASDIRTPVLAGLAGMLAPPRRFAARHAHAIAEEAGITVLAAVGGNAHNVFGLVEFEVPFDFVLPAREDLGADPARQLVPYDAVRQMLRQKIRRSLRVLAALQDLFGRRMLVIESPPPIGDDAQIVNVADPFFSSRFGSDWQVATPLLRYKVWRVSSEIYAEFCDERGLDFVAAPVAAMDDGMFLTREGWAASATHANAWYGALVLKEVKALLDGPRQANGTQRPAPAGPP